jgi:hypothetical protein
VRVALRGQAGAEVEELPNPPLGRHPLDHALEEPTVGPGAEDDLGHELLDPLNVGPVGRAVGAAPQGVVVNAGRGRTVGHLRVVHRHLQKRKRTNLSRLRRDAPASPDQFANPNPLSTRYATETSRLNRSTSKTNWQHNIDSIGGPHESPSFPGGEERPSHGS